MRRVTIAVTLGFGLAIAGCGGTPPADVPAKPEVSAETPKPAATVDGNEKAPMPGETPAVGAPKAKMGGGGPGGGSGMLPGYGPPPGTLGPDGKPAVALTPQDKKKDGDAKKEEEKKTEGDAKKDEKKEGEPKKDDAPKTAGVTLSAEEVAAIKELPEADQAAALAQKICPVQEDDDGKPNHLGAMGKPIKKVIKGKTVYLCCKGCVEDLEKDPDKFLAKLAK